MRDTLLDGVVFIDSSGGLSATLPEPRHQAAMFTTEFLANLIVDSLDQARPPRKDGRRFKKLPCKCIAHVGAERNRGIHMYLVLGIARLDGKASRGDNLSIAECPPLARGGVSSSERIVGDS